MYISHPIVVQFEQSARGLRGRTLLNPFGVRKIALIDGKARLPVQPGNNEVWLCSLKRDTDPHSGEKRGALIVLPVRPLNESGTRTFRAMQSHYSIWSEDQAEVQLMPPALLQIAQRPEHFGLLAEAVARLRLRSMRSPFWATQVELRRMIGQPDLLPAKTLEIDTPDTFARMSGLEHPVRVVVLARAEQESCVSLKIKQAERRLFVNHFNVGMLSASEPVSMRMTSSRSQSLHFWSAHAHVFQQEIMDQPFTSTWREVMETASRPPELKRMRERPRPQASEPDPDREMDGPLLV